MDKYPSWHTFGHSSRSAWGHTQLRSYSASSERAHKKFHRSSCSMAKHWCHHSQCIHQAKWRAPRTQETCSKYRELRSSESGSRFTLVFQSMAFVSFTITMFQNTESQNSGFDFGATNLKHFGWCVLRTCKGCELVFSRFLLKSEQPRLWSSHSFPIEHGTQKTGNEFWLFQEKRTRCVQFYFLVAT